MSHSYDSVRVRQNGNEIPRCIHGTAKPEDGHPSLLTLVHREFSSDTLLSAVVSVDGINYHGRGENHVGLIQGEVLGVRLPAAKYQSFDDK